MKAKSDSAGKAKGSTPTRQVSAPGKADSSSENYECPREQIIAEAAYFRAEQRGFAPGNEMSDWLQAEADMESVLRSVQ
ncbi:MAG: DUF2934 domain-containing protein [Rhodocyclaceae bacterium]|nr:DUF2934 domain-containing protein [Rhodocyclaceae bacterium]